jgi:hypothetical protein
MRFVPNIERLTKAWIEKWEIKSQNGKAINEPRSEWWWNKSETSPAMNNGGTSEKWTFSIKDIKLGNWYEWYIKLSYNYGMFITVKWVEWLLHKNFIIAPDWVEWKKYYNIWDKIKVKAKEFKVINDEKRVVWSQK